MAGVNQLLPFANGATTNVITFDDWSALAARQSGFQSGIASSQQFNYILAQGGAAGYVVGQMVADYTDETATISATPLYQAFKQAIVSFVGASPVEVTATGTTEPRTLSDRFADIANVKDHGAKGDGVEDDTAAFLSAVASGSKAYVPSGEYVVDITPDVMGLLFGEGVLSFPTGRRVDLSFLGAPGDLRQRFICDLKSAGSNKVVQDASVCDGEIFTSQQEGDSGWDLNSTVRITQYAQPSQGESFPFSLDSTAGQIDYEASVVLSGLGHGEGCQAIKEDGQVYIISSIGSDEISKQGKGFCKIRWNGASTSQSDIERFECANAPTYSQVSVSSDGAYLLFASGYSIYVFDRKDLESDPTNTEPLSVFQIQAGEELTLIVRSGVACDGIYVYVLLSGNSTYLSQVVQVYTVDGTFVKSIRNDTAAAFSPEEFSRGTVGGNFVTARETEGLCVVDGSLFYVAKAIVSSVSSYCTYEGNTYVAIADSTGEPPTEGSYWALTRHPFEDASEWSAETSYTGATTVAVHRYLIALERDTPNSQSEVVAPVYLNAMGEVQDSPASRLDSANGGRVNIGTRYASGASQDYAYFANGVFRVINYTNGVPSDFYPEILALDEGAAGSQAVRLQMTGGTEKGATIALFSNSSPVDPGAFVVWASGTRSVYANGEYFRVYNQKLEPRYDNTTDLGGPSNRWTQVYAASGTINTSDQREKSSISDPDDAIIRAWEKVSYKVFQFKDAVAKKGDAARFHVGVIAQQVVEAFESEGIDPFSLGIVCYDTWDDQYDTVEVVDVPAVLDAEGKTIIPAVTHVEKQKAVSAGERLGIRYDEAFSLESICARKRIAAMQSTLDKLIEKIGGI